MRAVPATKLAICGTRGDAYHGSGNSGLAQQLKNADKGMRVAVFAPHVADPVGDPEVRPAAVRLSVRTRCRRWERVVDS